MRKLLISVLLLCASSLHAQSFVQVQNNFASGSSTSLAVTIATTSGNFVLVAEGQGTNNTNDTTPTDSASQTYTHIVDGSPNATAETSFYYVAGSAVLSSVTCNFSASSATRICIVLEISGAATASPIDASATGSSSGATSCPSGSLTTTNANDILVFACRVGATQTTWTQGAGYTIPNNNVATGNSGSNSRSAIQYKVVTTTQSAVTTSMTYGASTTNGNVFVGIKSSGGGAAAAGFDKRRRIEQMEE